MTAEKSTRERRFNTRKQQGQALTENEADLLKHSTDKEKDEFFARITPLLQPLKDYLERRLRIASLFQQIRTPTITSEDLLDRVILEAYKRFETRPKDLTLEMWLYQIATQVADDYVKRAEKRDARRVSYESLRGRELRTLEELAQVSADAEGEPYLAEDMDDSEYEIPEVNPPTTSETPEENLEKKEELELIVNALSSIPRRDLIVFELYAVEGFSADEVSKIMNITPSEVNEIVSRVRRTALSRLGATGTNVPKEKAS